MQARLRRELGSCRDHQAMLRRFHIDEAIVAPTLESLRAVELRAKDATEAARSELHAHKGGVRSRRATEARGAAKLEGVLAAARSAVARLSPDEEEDKLVMEDEAPVVGNAASADAAPAKAEVSLVVDLELDGLNDDNALFDGDIDVAESKEGSREGGEEGPKESNAATTKDGRENGSAEHPPTHAVVSKELGQARASRAFASEQLSAFRSKWLHARVDDDSRTGMLQEALAVAEEWQDRLALSAAMREGAEGRVRLADAQRATRDCATLLDRHIAAAWLERRCGEAGSDAEGAELCSLSAECAIASLEARTLLLPVTRGGSRVTSHHFADGRGFAATAEALGKEYTRKNLRLEVTWRVDNAAIERAERERVRAIRAAEAAAAEEAREEREFEERIAAEKARGVRHAKGGDLRFPAIKSRAVATARVELTAAYEKLDLPDHIDNLDVLLAEWTDTGGFIDKLIAAEVRHAPATVVSRPGPARGTRNTRVAGDPVCSRRILPLPFPSPPPTHSHWNRPLGW